MDALNPPGGPGRTWSVRELADELGVTTRTLRFYEAEGLLAPTRAGTQRIYTSRDHTRLVLILRGRRFGMSLPEIREIVDMYEDAATGERTQLLTLLGRLDGIAADLLARRRDLTRTLDEVLDVARQCRERLADLPQAPEPEGLPVPEAEVPAMPPTGLPEVPEAELPEVPGTEPPPLPESEAPAPEPKVRRVQRPADLDDSSWPASSRSRSTQERRRA